MNGVFPLVMRSVCGQFIGLSVRVHLFMNKEVGNDMGGLGFAK